MNDEDLERKLGRFRIVRPPERLRVAVVDRGSGPAVPASAWMPTAATVVAAMILYCLSAYERAVIRVKVDQAALARAANVELVARVLGGGPQSLLVATTVVSLDEPKVETSR